jgi:hypothetical protein
MMVGIGSTLWSGSGKGRRAAMWSIASMTSQISRRRVGAGSSGLGERPEIGTDTPQPFVGYMRAKAASSRQLLRLPGSSSSADLSFVGMSDSR